MPVIKKGLRLKSFWPLFLLLIFSLILCGIIYAAAFSNMLQDDLNSLSFTSHRVAPQKTQTQAGVKTAPKNTPK